MIQYTTGNILDSNAQALVNTVNTLGVMGKGIALQFKKAFIGNYKAYTAACNEHKVEIGKMFVTIDKNLNTEKVIINFPTKGDWRKPSEYEYIEKGLNDLIQVIKTHNITSIAIPPLGAGNGGLDWQRVKQMIVDKLSDLLIDVFIYEPTTQITEYLKNERVKLTQARALLLYMLYELVKSGEFVSEFSSEKLCYFLQRFGAKKYFNLQFAPNFYGPYSGKVRFVLNALNGSYIMGFSDMNKKPFEPLTLVADGYEYVKNMVETNNELYPIAQKTSNFLNGYYSDFALELLSSVDYIASNDKTFDKNHITQKLMNWNNRKRIMFSNPKYIDISINHLQTNYESFGITNEIDKKITI